MNRRFRGRSGRVRKRLSWVVGLLMLLALWPIGCVASSHPETYSCISVLLLPLPWVGENNEELTFVIAVAGAVLAFAVVRWLPWRRRRSTTLRGEL